MRLFSLCRWAFGFYTAIAAIGHTAHSAVEIKEIPPSFIVRQGSSAVMQPSSQAACEAEAQRRTPNPVAAVRTFEVKSGGGALLERVTSLQSCLAQLRSRLTEQGETKTDGSNVLSCVESVKYSSAFQPPTCSITYNFIAKFTQGAGPGPAPDPEPPCTCPEPEPITCPPIPPNQTRPGSCPSGTVGSWTQTGVTSFSPAPVCAPTVTWTPSQPPANVCVPISVEPIEPNTLMWTPPTHNERVCMRDEQFREVNCVGGDPITDLAGYRISYNTTGGSRVVVIQVGPNVTRYSLGRLPPGNWYAFVRSFNSHGRESAPSNVRNWVVR